MHRSEQEKRIQMLRKRKEKLNRGRRRNRTLGHKRNRDTGMGKGKLKCQFGLFLTIVSIFHCALVVDSTPFDRARPTQLLNWRDKGASGRSNATVEQES